MRAEQVLLYNTTFGLSAWRDGEGSSKAASRRVPGLRHRHAASSTPGLANVIPHVCFLPCSSHRAKERLEESRFCCTCLHTQHTIQFLVLHKLRPATGMSPEQAAERRRPWPKTQVSSGCGVPGSVISDQSAETNKVPASSWCPPHLGSPSCCEGNSVRRETHVRGATAEACVPTFLRSLHL